LLSAENQAALGQRYTDIFGVFLKHRASIARVTLWGLRDADSWRRTLSPLHFEDSYSSSGFALAWSGTVAARWK
jgi:endo-1,4-beta-xylanase